MPAWQITAFRQPKPLGFVVEINGVRLGPGDIFFRHEPDGQKIVLHLFIRGLTEERYELLGNMAFILLDSALGEYAVESQVGFIDFHVLPDNPEAAELAPFRSLPEIFGVILPE